MNMYRAYDRDTRPNLWFAGVSSSSVCFDHGKFELPTRGLKVRRVEIVRITKRVSQLWIDQRGFKYDDIYEIPAAVFPDES